MANTLDPMDLKQILTLHKDDYNNRQIGKTLGISRNTINTYIKRFKASEYSIKELLTFDNQKLDELFTSRTTLDTARQDKLMKYFEQINKARSHPGFTFWHHYQEYSQSVDNPYSYPRWHTNLFALPRWRTNPFVCLSNSY